MSRVVIVALLGVLGTTGCGPLISSYLIVSAQAEVDGARAAEAEKYALYEFTAAREYLHKSKEEQGYADFGPSIDFAAKAKDLAERATARCNAEKRKLTEPAAAEWSEPEVGSAPQPHVIIKKKEPPSGLKVVPIPAEPGPSSN